jgi:hypothetical protein
VERNRRREIRPGMLRGNLIVMQASSIDRQNAPSL